MSVFVDHNYPSENAMRVLKANGEPVANAAIRVYAHTPYYANSAVAPVVAQTTTNAEGFWDAALTLSDSRTWVIVAEKFADITTKYWEITT